MKKATVTPKYVITVYSEGSGSHLGTNMYLEQAKVVNGSISEFRPMDVFTARYIATALAKQTQTPLGGIVPEGLIYIIPNRANPTIIWRKGPQVVNVNYIPELNIPDGEIPIPPLLWVFINGSISVYAYKEWKGDETELFEAPFHNVYDSGRVCMGTGSKMKVLENDTIESVIKKFEFLFFNTRASEIHYKNPHLNYNTLHKELRDGIYKNFPLDKLRKHSVTIDSLLNISDDDS